MHKSDYIPQPGTFLQNHFFWSLIFLLLSCYEMKAQTPRFSQYEAAPLMLNPALAGAVEDISFNVNYRIQRLGQINYQTGFFSAVLPLYRHGQEPVQIGGLAFSAIHDMAGEAGEVKTREAHLTAAYNLLIDKHRIHVITFGLQGGYAQTGIDFGQLYWPSQLTYNGFDLSKVVSLDQYEQSFGVFKVATGAFWQYTPANHPFRASRYFSIFGGLAVAHINEPDFSVMQGATQALPRLFTFYGGSEHRLNNRISLRPSFLFMRQRQQSQFSLGTQLQLAHRVDASSPSEVLNLQLGTWYRFSEAMIFLVGLSNQTFQAALSFDAITSQERAAIQHQQAFELSLGYRFLRNLEPKKFSTPLF